MADHASATTPSHQALKAQTDRFLTVNEGRLARLRESLQGKQQQCLELIPLLLHTHLPGSPGYLSQPAVPAGIIHYRPSPGAVQLLQSFNRGARPTQLSHLDARIMGLYLMGSSGSLGQSISSDLDIWLCYRSDLSGEQIRLLDAKAHAISEWAQGFNLEVHFFLMDAHHFQGGDQRSLTGENCGSTQHFLLLDEFYRTGQLLAGATPLWWQVPSDREHDYATLIGEYQSQGLARREDAIDFGPLPTLPPGEFIGAGMWQLYKGIDSPHKSVLKLLLLEIYARDFPRVTSLAHQYKNAIHAGRLALDDLDPYVMLYRRIEDYLLARDEPQRLELVRRCFYFKSGLVLSRPMRSQNWRRRLMQQLVRDWGWDDTDLAYLDSHANWPVQDVMRERKLLINELTLSYRFLTQFAAEHQSSHLMSQQDLLILSRKLHAAFDRRRGKIDFVSFGQDVDFSGEKIRIHEELAEAPPERPYWAAYSPPRSGGLGPPLKTASGLLETLLWCHLNGLLHAHLHIPVFGRGPGVGEFEVRKTMAALRQALPADQPTVAQTQYYRPARIERVLLFVNLGVDPLQRLTRRGLQKISARSNSLDFSALRENLVCTIDMVLINSWGEVVVERFAEGEVLPQAMHFLLSRLGRQKSGHRPEVDSFCHNQTRPQAIADRVQALIEDAMSALFDYADGQPVRFLYNLGEQYRALRLHGRQLDSLSFDTETELVDWLGQEQAEPSRLLPDRMFETDRNQLRAVIDQQAQAGLTLIYQLDGRQVTLYLIDEQGSLLRFRQRSPNLATLMAPLLRFLKITEHRLRSQENAIDLPQRPLHCYEMTTMASGAPALKRARLTGLLEEGRFINLQAVMERNSEGGYEYLMLCNDREFSTLELGERFYPVVASYVLGLRAKGQRYPVYITDLALSDRVLAGFPYGQAQTVHYVRHKLRLEQRINEAMRTL